MVTDNLVWIDLEMTGLNDECERIIEIATVVTSPTLEVIAEGPVFAIHQPEALLEKMDSWNTRQHGISGLADRVRASIITEQHAMDQTLGFLRQYVEAGRSPMCGNSVHQDRRFLRRYMPALEQFFHYRHLDVSTLKELAQRWAPSVCAGFQKESRHLARDDILESIRELKYYRDTLFRRDLIGPC